MAILKYDQQRVNLLFCRLRTYNDLTVRSPVLNRLLAVEANVLLLLSRRVMMKYTLPVPGIILNLPNDVVGIPM